MKIVLVVNLLWRKAHVERSQLIIHCVSTKFRLSHNKYTKLFWNRQFICQFNHLKFIRQTEMFIANPKWNHQRMVTLLSEIVFYIICSCGLIKKQYSMWLFTYKIIYICFASGFLVGTYIILKLFILSTS